MRNSKPLLGLDGRTCETASGDLADLSLLEKACQGCDGVFHVAAIYSYWSGSQAQEIYRTNVDGTLNIVNAAYKAGVRRVVFTSTVATLKWPGKNRLANETSQAQISDLPGNYKKSKLLGEQAALSMNGQIEVVVVNPTAPFGTWDVRPTPTGRIVLNFLNHGRPGYLDTGVNVSDVDCVALGHLKAFTHGRPGERYILGGENMSLKRIYTTLGQITGLKRRPFKFPWLAARLLATIDENVRGRLGREPVLTTEAIDVAQKPMYVTTSKAEKELGLIPVAGRVGLAKAVDWFRHYLPAEQSLQLSEYPQSR